MASPGRPGPRSRTSCRQPRAGPSHGASVRVTAHLSESRCPQFGLAYTRLAACPRQAYPKEDGQGLVGRNFRSAAGRVVNSVSDGVNSVSDGVSSASDGVNSASDGVNSAPDGVNSAPDGVSSASDGVNSAPDGVNSASDGVNSASDGVNSAPDGVTPPPTE